MMVYRRDAGKKPDVFPVTEEEWRVGPFPA